MRVKLCTISRNNREFSNCLFQLLSREGLIALNTAHTKQSGCDMVLHNNYDAAYLVAPEARSRAGGFTYMGNHKGKPQIMNGAILVAAKIIKSVMSSEAEAEIGALFMNAKAILPLRITSEELGHKQPT